MLSMELELLYYYIKNSHYKTFRPNSDMFTYNLVKNTGKLSENTGHLGKKCSNLNLTILKLFLIWSSKKLGLIQAEDICSSLKVRWR